MQSDKCIYYVTVANCCPDSGLQTESFAWASTREVADCEFERLAAEASKRCGRINRQIDESPCSRSAPSFEYYVAALVQLKGLTLRDARDSSRLEKYLDALDERGVSLAELVLREEGEQTDWDDLLEFRPR